MYDSDSLYLGFDLSTQQLKIIVTDKKLAALNTFNIEFDVEYKEKYGIKKGVIVNEEDGTIISPVLMWLDAIDDVFNKMKQESFPFEKVVGISGSCQQHGSVYWSSSAKDLLNGLDDQQSLSEQLKHAFAVDFSPNWQDHSTGKEIKDFEDLIGTEELARRTGSRAHYRFTGLQIRKLATRANPEKYNATWRISLVSSFVASVLLGKVTEIEQADGCGMNLYDVSKQAYDDELLALAAGVYPKLDGVDVNDPKYKKGIEDLKAKLGEINPISYKNIGNISPYFTRKYNFHPECKIYSFTGDNLATILALPLLPNDYLLSLGTSTTVLIITKIYNPSSQYHLFLHPTIPDHYMGMICYCNGSLAREKIRDKINEKYNVKDRSWDKFNEILDNCHGFHSKLGIYFPLGEIVPNASAQTKRCVLGENGEIIDVQINEKDTEQANNNFSIEDDVGSIIESQTLSCRLRAGPMLSKSTDSKSPTPQPNGDNLHQKYKQLVSKFKGELYTDGKQQTFESVTARPNRCYYVGGGANNQSIIRKMGSILAPTNGNYKVEISNACALGGAYKASWSHECEDNNKLIGYDKYINRLFETNDDLDKFDVEDKWDEYFDGLGLLARMEDNLKHD